MDSHLRCNDLKRRSQLNETAVVTTCSHIFCSQCANKLGLSRPAFHDRRCPACQAALLTPDDAVSTVLNPTEDYKTSVLSGLDPNTVMECAGRALVFWSHQTTQEVFYQEYLVKTLTEKYGNLRKQMENVIHDANSEMSALQSKISELQDAQEDLQKKNHELADMYKDKSKQFNQVTNLYNLLKSKAMKAQIQTAASETVSQALGSISSASGRGNLLSVGKLQHQMPPMQPPQTPASRQSNGYPVSNDGVEQLHRYQGSGTGSSRVAKRKLDAIAMPPPSRPPGSHRQVSQTTATSRHRTQLPLPQSFKQRDFVPRDSSIYAQRFGDEANTAHAQDGLMATPRASINRGPGRTTEPYHVREEQHAGMIDSSSRGAMLGGELAMRSTYFGSAGP